MHKTIETSKLQGAALDYAVALCEGIKWSQAYQPSTNWAQGGIIVERERLQITTCKADWVASTSCAVQINHKIKHRQYYYGSGSTPLIAAMRAYVAAKLGESVEIPAGIINSNE